jgi:demethylmenaquinone methyltransferase/2-methoxy-6-polyprenyl-1,4-benzoquinol methylase
MPSAQIIRPMFDAIADKYDFLNDLLSLFVHRYWKSKIVKKALQLHPQKILDAATGTGDLAFRLIQRNQQVEVLGIDFSSAMISRALSKRNKLSPQDQERINFQVENVEQISINNHAVDVAVISFGIRNVEHRAVAIKELSRIAKKGLLVLEFGRPQNALLNKLIYGALKLFVPTLGRLTKKPDAYQYLLDSSQAFPSGAAFLQELKQNSPYKNFSFETYFGGLVYLYYAGASHENS